MEKLGTLKVNSLSKGFGPKGQGLKVLDDVNLTVEPGEFISIVGQSGCGKTTFLRLVVGLESDYQGEILLDGKRLNGPDLERGVVFQDHRLLPWLTVEKNVGLGLKNAGKGEARRKVQEHIELVGLKGYEKHYPHQLSGGMSQRAAIARALVNRPQILMLDEPLGALDALTRMYMHQELERIWRQEGITMIMVTHDMDEAIFLSDRVVIMSSRPGTIKKIMPVKLARPRDRASIEFARIKEELLEEFHLHTETPFAYSI